MGGGLMQLVAYGAQDIYLTGNPQITFFKVVYRRHTNFSMETIQQTINGTSTLSSGTTSGDVTISRNGDLVSKVYVTSSTPGIKDGSSLISKVDCEIGGQLIDRHYKEWNQIWAELTTPASKQTGYKQMINSFNHGLHPTIASIDNTSDGVGMVQIPLFFWFCRNPGLALPLIALQYHEVKLKFTWGVTGDTSSSGNPVVNVWVDYIYLDTDERRRFAQVSHEYLIEQLQKDSFSGTKTTENLNFNHPVKELIWTSASANVYKDVKLVLNGHDRFAKQEEEYFQLRQPYEYHTNIPGNNINITDDVRPLNPPLNTGIRTQNNTVTQTAAALDEKASPDSPISTIEFEATTTNIPKVNDIIKISMSEGDHSNKDGMAPFFAQVTAKTTDPDPIITFTPSITTGFFPAGFTDGDHLHIWIYARGGRESKTSNFAKRINVYSFALKPEEHQPSGTCNFSRIDNAQLLFNTANGAAFNIYAVNYNVLRIMSGMGGLAYSN